MLSMRFLRSFAKASLLPRWRMMLLIPFAVFQVLSWHRSGFGMMPPWVVPTGTTKWMISRDYLVAVRYDAARPRREVEKLRLSAAPPYQGWTGSSA